MLKERRPVNFRVNGKPYSTRDPYHGRRNGGSNVNTSKEAPQYHTPIPKQKDKYSKENLVIFMIVGLLGAAGIELAIRTATSNLVMAGQIAGFLASTVSICIIKYKIGKGRYIGRQLKYAKGLYFWGVIFESLTLLAKFMPAFIPFYLYTVAFTGPALALAMQKLQELDEEDRLERIKKENKLATKILRAERDEITTSIAIKKELATLRSEDNLQDRRNGMMMESSKGWFAWWVLRRVVKQDMQVIYQNIQTRDQKKQAKKLNVSDAKVIRETKKRKTMGPRPENAANGIYCKAHGCDNKLGEGQKKYCSEKCGNRERARRLRERRKSQ